MARRLVQTHSAHLPGVLPLLQRVLTQPVAKHITAVIPGRRARAKTHRAVFDMRVNKPTSTGFKVVAKRHRTLQEIFVVCDSGLGAADLQAALDRELRKAL